ncbi:MAG: hypothetical protein ACKOZT_00250, partial [Cyanobium sp.]
MPGSEQQPTLFALCSSQAGGLPPCLPSAQALTPWALTALLLLAALGGPVAAAPTPSTSYPPMAPGAASRPSQDEGDGAIARSRAAQQLDAALLRLNQASGALDRERQEAAAERELLWGRAGRIEGALAALAGRRFSPTSRLMVSTYFTPGAVHFGGDQAGSYPAGPLAAPIPLRSRNAYPAANNAAWGAAAFNYETNINLLTSFSGSDLLYLRLNSGNANRSAFGGNPYNLLLLDKATAPRNGPDTLELTRLYYRFPLNREITALFGPLARPTHEITALRPWFYGAEPGPPILDFFTLNGAPATYNKATGATLGAQWKQSVPEGRPYLAVSASYVAPAADNANTADALHGAGIGGRLSRASLFAQAGVGGPGYVVALAWRQGQCDLNVRRGTQFANQRQPCAPAGSGETAQ